MYCVDIEIEADRWEELEKVMQSAEYNLLENETLTESPLEGIQEVMEIWEVAA